MTILKKMIGILILAATVLLISAAAVVAEESSERSVFTSGEVRIEADTLSYDTESGVIHAIGNVEVCKGQAKYYTEFVDYDTKKSTGNLAEFHGSLHAKEKDFLVSGTAMELADGIDHFKVQNGTMSRCTLPVPHYQIYAKEIDINGSIVNMRKAYFKINGKAIGYLPRFYMNMDWKIPSFRIGYTKKDGFSFSYYKTISEKTLLTFGVERKNKDDGEFSVGLEHEDEKIYDKFDIQYDLADFFKLENTFIYTGENWIYKTYVYCDGSDVDRSIYGLRVTHQYWDSPLGQWRLGALIRDEKQAASPAGGTHTGFQIDYKPHPYITLSYLGVDIHSVPDYELMSDDEGEMYEAGGNWMIEADVPFGKLPKLLTLGSTLIYNDNDFDWLTQELRVKYTTCCYWTQVGYDFVDENYELLWGCSF